MNDSMDYTMDDTMNRTPLAETDPGPPSSVFAPAATHKEERVSSLKLSDPGTSLKRKPSPGSPVVFPHSTR